MTELSVLNELLLVNNCVQSINIEMERDTLKYNLLLSLSETEDVSSTKLLIYFFDISNLVINEFGGGLTQFMRLRISRVGGGLDRIRYEIRDIERNKICFNCFSLEKLN